MCHRTTLYIALVLCLAALYAAETIVQLNVNRPFNDVNDRFVSFATTPEDLYEALNGSNRKYVTGMAALLGDSYVKFIGEYNFAANTDLKPRNPTKIIWKGFNRWTRAVNWTMIIPVPYTPQDWDSMQALKILNGSYMAGISDCIWQLGNDFGTARAKDYVTELNTLKLMVDTFRPYVDDWRVIGADVTAGSNVDETKRYLELSKDINAAYGWTQPRNLLPAASLGSYIYENDPALRMLLAQRVPVWLNLPLDTDNSAQRISKRLVGDETTDGLRWAQTLGDAASSGFDVLFKRMTLTDWERPNYSFYVTALFKKVMGSRVFPARPLNMFAPTNKLYTHCANAVSGGIAFMVVNTEDQPLTITVRSLSKLPSSEVWQYTLTSEREKVLLNNVKLSLNSTLRPQVKSKNPTKPLQLVTPPMSVSFWVLPTVNMEHCQFTEVEAGDLSSESSEERVKKSAYSSADRLLQQLIEETSLSRQRRFVLNNNSEQKSLLDKFLESLKVARPLAPLPVEAAPQKRNVEAEQPALSVRRREALEWLKEVLAQTRDVARLSRRARSTEDYFGPLFLNKRGKKSALTRKITEIRKPEKQVKPKFDFAEFDEEEFFKNVGEQSEPEYVRTPHGDVHMKFVEPLDGDEEEIIERHSAEDEATPRRKMKIISRSQESSSSNANDEKQIGGLFYESMPLPTLKPQKKLNIGEALNSLLYPEPFSKKTTKSPNKISERNDDSVEEIRKLPSSHALSSSSFAESFLHAQRELGKSFLSEMEMESKDTAEEDPEIEAKAEVEHESAAEAEVELEVEKPKVSSPTALSAKPPKIFEPKKVVTAAPADEKKETPKAMRLKDKLLRKKEKKKKIAERKTWWDSSALRQKRALPLDLPDAALRTNMIDKDDDVVPLGPIRPEQFQFYEYEVEKTQPPPITNLVTDRPAPTLEATTDKQGNKVTFTRKLVAVVKTKVSSFMNIFTRHINEWYNTLTKHAEEAAEEVTTMGNHIK